MQCLTGIAEDGVAMGASSYVVCVFPQANVQIYSTGNTDQKSTESLQYFTAICNGHRPLSRV